MNKKIKDLTKEEKESVCNKYYPHDCTSCPFYFGTDERWGTCCYLDVTEDFLNKKVELEEEEEED